MGLLASTVIKIIIITHTHVKWVGNIANAWLSHTNIWENFKVP